MIPVSVSLLRTDFEITEQPTRTYRMNQDSRFLRGHTDGLEAMKQAIYKILSTERYRYIIYSWNYGIELSDLYGEPVTFVCPEIERRIREALLWDKRIENVDGFRFDVSEKGTVHVSFKVQTVFGDVEIKKEVNI